MGNTPEATEAIEIITQSHITQVEAIARRLCSSSPLARMAGEDELISEAMVVLWELALEFDDSLGVPFTAFLGIRVQNRLVDWIRLQYGRVYAGKMSYKMVGVLSSISLSEHEDDHAHRVDCDPAMIDQAPSIEEQVISRDEWHRFWVEVAKLSDHERESLLWPLRDGTPQQYMAETNQGQLKVSYARSVAKRLVCEGIDRPLQKRPYGTGLKSGPVDADEASRDADDTDSGRFEEAQTTPALGEVVLDRAGPEARELLDLDGLGGSRALRSVAGGLQAGSPRRLRGAGRPDPARNGTGPHLLRDELCEPGPPRGGDRAGEPAPVIRATSGPRNVRERSRLVHHAAVVLAGPGAGQAAAMVVHGLPPTVASESKRGESGMSDLNTRRKHNHTLSTISDETLLELRKTKTMREIAEKYGCDTTTVSKRMTKIGVAGTRPRYDQLIPWRVRVEHTHALEVESLRLLGAYRAGRTPVGRNYRQLVRFLEKCLSESVVVHYDAETGFGYVPACVHSGYVHSVKDHPYYEAALCTQETEQDTEQDTEGQSARSA